MSNKEQQYVDEDGLLTTTKTTTTTTTTTTVTRSRGTSPNPSPNPTSNLEPVPDSTYGSEHSSGPSPAGSSITSQPPQQRLSGSDKAIPPSGVHPALRSLPPGELRQIQTASEEQDRRNAHKGKDPLVTIRESRALSNNGSMSSSSQEPTTRPSAFGNLKAATQGLNDVRNSLTGMYTAEQERYHARKPSAKDLKNQGQPPQIRNSPQRPDWNASEPSSDGNASQQLNYSSSNSTMGHSADGERSRRRSLGQVPASFSPESQGTAPHEKEMGTLKRLLKGKP